MLQLIVELFFGFVMNRTSPQSSHSNKPVIAPACTKKISLLTARFTFLKYMARTPNSMGRSNVFSNSHMIPYSLAGTFC